MSERLVDARGLLCPKPLILTKEALKESPQGQRITVLTDNGTACGNIERFLSDQGMLPAVEQKNGLYTLSFTKKTEDAGLPDCAGTPPKRRIIVIRSRRMGEGPDELGEILLKAFLNTIVEVSPLPAAILFYNSGIHMTRKGSACIEALKELQSRGVELLVCGTCVEYFRLKDEIEVGSISNMYTIMEAMAAADSILIP